MARFCYLKIYLQPTCLFYSIFQYQIALKYLFLRLFEFKKKNGSEAPKSNCRGSSKVKCSLVISVKLIKPWTRCWKGDNNILLQRIVSTERRDTSGLPAKLRPVSNADGSRASFSMLKILIFLAREPPFWISLRSLG